MHERPQPNEDSLDLVERVMAIEEALIHHNSSINPEERERLIIEIDKQMERGRRLG